MTFWEWRCVMHGFAEFNSPPAEAPPGAKAPTLDEHRERLKRFS